MTATPIVPRNNKSYFKTNKTNTNTNKYNKTAIPNENDKNNGTPNDNGDASFASTARPASMGNPLDARVARASACASNAVAAS